jgi:hypothetical protein
MKSNASEKRFGHSVGILIKASYFYQPNFDSVGKATKSLGNPTETEIYFLGFSEVVE